MYRVVLDPGVLIAALISARGAPRALLAAWMDGAFELLVSPKVVAELARVFKRPKVRPFVGVHEAPAFVALLERFAALCPDAASPPRVSPDPRSAYLVALARSQSADFLVSGDARLRRLKNTQPRVLAPRAFLNRLK